MGRQAGALECVELHARAVSTNAEAGSIRGARSCSDFILRGMAIVSQLRRITDAYYRALDKRGPDAVAAYWTPNCDFAAPGARGRGPDFIRSYIQVFYDGNPDLKHTVIKSVEVGDLIVLELTAGGTNTGPLRLPTGEVPPTGSAWRLPVCVMLRVQNGVFLSYHSYFDMADFIGQIGLMPLALTA